MRWLKAATMAAALAAPAAHAGTNLTPTLKLTAEERFDDDALLRTASGAGQLMTKVSPEAGLALEQRTLELKARYALDFLWRHGSGSMTFDHRGGLDLRKALSRRARVEGRVSVWRVSDPTSLPRLGMARTLTPTLYGRAEASGGYALTPRLNGRAGYRFEGVQVYEAGRPPGFVHAPFAELWYDVTRRTELGVEYRFQYFVFGFQSANAHAGFAALRHRLSRRLTFTGRAGPVFLQDHADPAHSGVLPRVTLELARDGELLDVGAVVGHDLVGASGFTSAIWADFASLMWELRVSEPVRIFGAGSYYRNGRAPNEGLNPFGARAASTTQGYAVGGGLEWRVARSVRVQGTFDRIAQVDAVGVTTSTALARNIAAVRLVIEAY